MCIGTWTLRVSDFEVLTLEAGMFVDAVLLLPALVFSCSDSYYHGYDVGCRSGSLILGGTAFWR